MSDRLDEIKESWVSEGHWVKIDREHFEYLIEQAEKVEKLQQKIERLEKQLEKACFEETEYKPKLKKGIKIQPRVSYGGRLPVRRERE